MAFPSVSATTNANAQAAFQSACNAAGLQLSTLSGLSQVQLALANLLDYDPTTSDVPAGNIVAGTFGANTATPTGAYTFSGNVTIGAGKFVVTAATGAVAFTGAVTGITTLSMSGGLTKLDTGINPNPITFINTGGTSGIGLESSTSSNWGATAYDFTIFAPASRGVSIFTGAAQALRLAPTGAATFASTVDATGLSISTKAFVFGANDSAGAGYRTVVLTNA